MFRKLKNTRQLELFSKGTDMTQQQLLNKAALKKSAVDVLFVTDQHRMPVRIADMLTEQGFSWNKISTCDFIGTSDQIRHVGTVLLDTSEVAQEDSEQFSLSIKKLDDTGVASIFINNAIGLSIDDYPLSTLLQSASVDEIWGRIETNVAFRKNCLKRRCHERRNIQGLNDDTADQLRVAGQVQREFLPSSFPNISSVKWATVFQPADWVSGDIYDISRLDEQHIGFYIADAVGHSMPAALLTIFIKQAIVMRATQGDDYRIFAPAEVIKNLNAKMTEQSLGGCLFATCCYCLLNTKTMQLTYARAGHPYPVLMKNGQTPTQLESLGGLLGVFTDSEFEQQTVQMTEGDKLFLYSDGIEPSIGTVDDDERFEFTDQFTSLADMPVEDMMAKFGELAESRQVTPEELDDVTAIALEIM